MFTFKMILLVLLLSALAQYVYFSVFRFKTPD